MVGEIVLSCVSMRRQAAECTRHSVTPTCRGDSMAASNPMPLPGTGPQAAPATAGCQVTSRFLGSGYQLMRLLARWCIPPILLVFALPNFVLRLMFARDRVELGRDARLWRRGGTG